MQVPNDNKPSSPAPKLGLGIKDIEHVPLADRELRFTRNRLAGIFAILGIFFFSVAGFLQLTGYDTISAYLPAKLWLMQIICLIPAFICFWLSRRAIKHVAIILTPLGVEYLPFFNARKSMTWVPWQHITKLSPHSNRISLTLANKETFSLPLFSLSKHSRTLVLHALNSRLSKIHASQSSR